MYIKGIFFTHLLATSSQVSAGLCTRGRALSGRPKSHELALFQGIAFRPPEPSRPIEHPKRHLFIFSLAGAIRCVNSIALRSALVLYLKYLIQVVSSTPVLKDSILRGSHGTQ